MELDMLERREFLLALGAAGLAPALLGASAKDPVADVLDYALVLSGGGARGAYEAGLVGALVAMGSVSDGVALAPYELVCGTSIGALNGWFVATAQYTKMRKLWNGISGEYLMQPKPQYAPLRDPESGVIDRAIAAVQITGLVRNQTAILESKPVYDWIVRNIDPNAPLVMPLVWAVTNLTLQRPEYFYLSKNGGVAMPERVVNALRMTLGPHTIVREATPDLLHSAIFASAALPIVFDPVEMPGPDGTINQYCDGGVASNSPVGIAHATSKAADVVLLDPPFEPDSDLSDAVEIAFSVFGTMQRKIFESEMRNVYAQSLGRRSFDRLTQKEAARAVHGNVPLSRFIDNLPITDLRFIRPEKELPVRVAGFEDQEGINKAYDIGWTDVGRGFTAYDYSTFQL
jgi:predicted acylesterase/phospholipase RssA